MEGENVAEDVASGVPFVVVIVGTSEEGICTGSAVLCCDGTTMFASEVVLRLSALIRDALSLLPSEWRERENMVDALGGRRQSDPEEPKLRAIRGGSYCSMSDVP